MIWAIDLDNTITADPDAMRALMCGLRSEGTSVHIVSGVIAPTVTKDDLLAKEEALRKLGCGDCYDRLVGVANPKNDVSDLKVAYMRHVGASVLVDNLKKNCKAARKAGFLALRVMGAKRAKAA